MRINGKYRSRAAHGTGRKQQYRDEISDNKLTITAKALPEKSTRDGCSDQRRGYRHCIQSSLFHEYFEVYPGRQNLYGFYDEYKSLCDSSREDGRVLLFNRSCKDIF
jgi:hypothetical protein